MKKTFEPGPMPQIYFRPPLICATFQLKFFQISGLDLRLVSILSISDIIILCNFPLCRSECKHHVQIIATVIETDQQYQIWGQLWPSNWTWTGHKIVMCQYCSRCSQCSYKLEIVCKTFSGNSSTFIIV